MNSGEYDYGANVEIGYFDQMQQNLDQSKKELDEIKNRNKKAKPKQTVRQRNRVRHKQPQRKKKIKRKVR